MLFQRNNAIVHFLFILFFTAAFCTAAFANEANELKQVKQQLQQLDQRIKRAKTQRSKTQTSLQKIEQELAERNLRQEQTALKLKQIELESTKLILEKDAINGQYLQALGDVKKLLVSTYQMGQQSGLKRLLSQQDPAQISRFSNYSNYVARSRNRLITHTQDLAAKLQTADQALAQRKAKLSKLTTNLRKDQVYLEKLRSNRLATISDIEAELSNQSSKADKLKSREKQLSAVLARLAAERKKKREQAAARAQQRAKDNNQTTRKSPSPLKKQRIVATGTLPLPAQADLVARFGHKRQDSGVPWSGIMLRGQAGSPVRAIAAGEVVYADWLSGYGQLVIIDHGNDLMSLYGHNSALTTTIGQQVAQSDVVALMGDTAGLRSAALYFEIRHHGEPVDPLKWCRA